MSMRSHSLRFALCLLLGSSCGGGRAATGSNPSPSPAMPASPTPATAATAAPAAGCTPLPWRDETNAATATYQGKLDEVEASAADERMEQAFIIILERPACLPASADVKETAEVHVFSTDPKVRAQLEELKGKHVVATGDGFVALTAHHHRPIVVDIKSIAAK